jgi:uncharacterized protein (DUF2236 family)
VFGHSGAIILPGPLQHWIDDLVQAFLQPGPAIDFSAPEGEPALVPPTSVSWRIFKNPATVFIGGVAAVLLELAEPRVRDGIWQHSSFRTDPLARLRHTGLAAMMTVYGPQSKAQAMIAGVVRRHDRVRGRTSDGQTYWANDKVLLDWVQATACFGFTGAYHTYVRHLSAAERSALLAEGRPAAHLYGATGAPASPRELDALFETMMPRLVASPVVFEFLEILARVGLLPPPMRAFQRVLLKAAVDLLPAAVRERLKLGPEWSLRPSERALVQALTLASERLVVRSSPAVQSCRRLGLPDTYLHERW